MSQCRYRAESVPLQLRGPVNALPARLASTSTNRGRVVAKAAHLAVLVRTTRHRRALIAFLVNTRQCKGSRRAIRVQLGSTVSRKEAVHALAVHREALATVMVRRCALSATLVDINLAQGCVLAKPVPEASLARTRLPLGVRAAHHDISQLMLALSDLALVNEGATNRR